MSRPLKWVQLTTVPDQLVGEMWRDLIRGEGISAVIRPGDTVSFLGVSAYPCRIMVQEKELAHACVVLRDHLGLESE